MKNSNDTKINNSLSGILCCINFNEVHYDNIEFLKDLYSNFVDVVFYGPERKQGFEVNQLCHHRGYFSYAVILDAIKKFPDYNGYIFVNDDCIMNIWQFINKDKTKVWLQPFHSKVNRHDYKESTWFWLNEPCGISAYGKAFLQIPRRYRERLKSSFGSEDAVICGPADCFYLPKRRINDFASLFDIYFSNRVFTEIAVPTGLYAIEDKAQITVFKGHDRVTFPLSFIPYDLKAKIFYRGELDLYHPLKLSNSKMRSMVKNMFNVYLFQRNKFFSKILRLCDLLRPFIWFWAYMYMIQGRFLRKIRY
ncbi:MAG: hypothetical protein K9L86_01305 [Candidatus Omnitrophica bacterium]|nr:hypothetical protein [Candidatus Omnitrophota bacterium]